MTAAHSLVKAYFFVILPVLGGLAVAFGAERFLDIPDLFALALGGAFGWSVVPLAAQAADVSDLPEAFGSVVVGTVLVGLVPVVAGVAFTVAAKDGAFPALGVGFAAAAGGWVAALAAVAAKVPQWAGDAVVRGLSRGGFTALPDKLKKQR